MGLSALPWWHASKLNLATAGSRGQVQAMETLPGACLAAAGPQTSAPRDPGQGAGPPHPGTPERGRDLRTQELGEGAGHPAHGGVIHSEPHVKGV